jgi:hypothetical protein
MFPALALAACAALGACDNNSFAISPSSTGSSYAGEWRGTTSQGQSVTISVSAGQKVTSISVGYAFSGCSGSNTYGSLSLDIAPPLSQPPIPFPPLPSVPSSPSSPEFGYTTGNPEGPDFTQIDGIFDSTQSMSGTLILTRPVCGNVFVFWSATKH